MAGGGQRRPAPETSSDSSEDENEGEAQVGVVLVRNGWMPFNFKYKERVHEHVLHAQLATQVLYTSTFYSYLYVSQTIFSLYVYVWYKQATCIHNIYILAKQPYKVENSNNWELVHVYQ